MAILLTFVLAVLCVVALCSIYYDSRAYRARLRTQRQAQTTALQYHPVVRAKVQEDRAHELATRKLDLDTFLATHRIKAGYYSINEPISTMTSFPAFFPPQAIEQQKEQQQGPVVESTLVYERPSLESLLPLLPYNGLQLPYGRNLATGELLTSTLIDAVHILILGDIGMGKSTQASGLLTALCARNDPQHVQLALLDHEGITSEPFHILPHTRYLAESPEEAAQNLRFLVRELERRQEKRWLVRPDIDPQTLAFPLILLFIEEFVTLKNALKGNLRTQALEDFTRISLQGRKFGMFMLCIGQTGYLEKDIRDAQRQFQSKIALALHPTAARAAGFTNTELLNQNNAPRIKGRFVLEGTKGPALVMAPHIEYGDIPRLLGRSQDVPRTFPGRSQDVPTTGELSNGNVDGGESELDYRVVERMREMIGDHKNQSEIIAALFPNMRKADAIEAYRKYLARLVVGK